MHSETRPQAAELARYFRAAAEQRRLLEPRRGDRRHATEGNAVLHAVDADVVMLFTAPFDVAVSFEHRHYGYGEVFPGDDRINAVGVGKVLAHFIFYQLGGAQAPLLLLPPIDQEMRDIFRAVMRNAMSEGVKAREQVAEVQKLSAQIKTITDEKERTRWLSAAAPDLIRFLAGSRGPGAEMGRFSCLARDKRIVPLDQALEQNLESLKPWQQAFQPPQSLVDRIWLIAQCRDWFDRITTRPRAKSTSRIQDDALMLARLEWINRKLENNARLVLITGDQSLHEAARTYVPDGERRCFADLWLRHPRSYFAEPEVLSPENPDNAEAETKFINWLDTFLGKLQVTGSDYMVVLDKIRNEPLEDLARKAANVLDNHPAILDEFKSRWSAYILPTVLAHDFKDASETTDNERVSELVRNIVSQVSAVEEALGKKIAEAWGAVFESVMEAGFLFVRQEAKRSRNPPVLFFNSLPHATDFVRKVLATEGKNPIADFAQNIKTLRDEDDTGYTYTLAFGMLFAAQGAWAVTAILAKRALDIAPESEDKKNITGREAWYLLAVAKRHQIRKVPDLKDVSNSLDEAEKCLKKERIFRSDLLKGDYRFASERIALDVGYRLFERFLEEDIPETVRTLGQIEVEIKDLVEKNAVPLSSETNEKARWVQRNVERRLLVNLFMVALLQARGSQPFPEALQPYFQQFKCSVEIGDTQEPHIPNTFFVDSVFFVTCWWRETDLKEKQRLRDKVAHYLREDGIKLNLVMPYDSHRFTYLRNFVIPDR